MTDKRLRRAKSKADLLQSRDGKPHSISAIGSSRPRLHPVAAITDSLASSRSRANESPVKLETDGPVPEGLDALVSTLTPVAEVSPRFAVGFYPIAQPLPRAQHEGGRRVQTAIQPV